MRVIHISYTPPKQVPSTFYFLFLKEFLTRFLLHCFIILAPEFERAFGKSNCRSLSAVVTC